MIALIQRVTNAQVAIDGVITAEINKGLLALVGVEANDTEADITWLAHRLLHYRLFPDAKDKMNLNVQQIQGQCLLVPQFTLAADTKTGLRPSFSCAANPEQGLRLFKALITQLKNDYSDIASGKFGANMQVSLCNDGPVTFWLQSPK